jgi:23S rRNA (cytosine1962-C5)-methyltransferase
LADAPIRWIQEDARVFVRRELKRGNRYDAVVLDPPSFGHGPKGQVWKLEEDLDPLLESCAALTREGLRFCLLTCHSVGMTPSVLEDRLRSAFDRGSTGRIESAPLELIDPSGRGLPGGALARVVG